MALHSLSIEWVLTSCTDRFSFSLLRLNEIDTQHLETLAHAAIQNSKITFLSFLSEIVPYSSTTFWTDVCIKVGNSSLPPHQEKRRTFSGRIAPSYLRWSLERLYPALIPILKQLPQFRFPSYQLDCPSSMDELNFLAQCDEVSEEEFYEIYRLTFWDWCGLLSKKACEKYSPSLPGT